MSKETLITKADCDRAREWCAPDDACFFPLAELLAKHREAETARLQAELAACREELSDLHDQLLEANERIE